MYRLFPIVNFHQIINCTFPKFPLIYHRVLLVRNFSKATICFSNRLFHFSKAPWIFSLSSHDNYRYFVSLNVNYALRQKKDKFSAKANHEKENVRKLQSYLHCSLKEADKIMKESEYLSSFGVDDFIRRCDVIIVPKKFILSNSWILSLTDEDLDSKRKLLNKWNFKNTNSGLPLFKLPIKLLNSLSLRIIKEASCEPDLKDSNRLTYLSKLLQVDESSVVELAVKRLFILTVDFQKMKSVIETVLSYGMLPSYLLNDIWIINYNLDDIKRRLEILSLSFSHDELRPWMLHCKQSVFERSVELKEENRSALEPFTTSDEYLSNRLNVSSDIIQVLKNKHPPLRRVQVLKLKDILDFLFSEGFTSLQVCSAPRVLCHSLSTLKGRLKILQEVGYRPSSLMTLCKTQKQFSQFVGKLRHAEKYKKSYLQ